MRLKLINSINRGLYFPTGMCKSCFVSMDTFMDIGMRKKNLWWCGFFFFCVLDMNIFFVSDMDRFWLVIGEFFGMENFVGHEIFCWSWENFVWIWNFLLVWVFCGHLDDCPTLFCRISKVEVAFRCWKAYFWSVTTRPGIGNSKKNSKKIQKIKKPYYGFISR